MRRTPQYALLVQVQACRLRDSIIAEGPEMIPLANSMKQSYIMVDDSDSNGHARSSIGQDITHLLAKLQEQTALWNRIKEAQDAADAERRGEAGIPGKTDRLSSRVTDPQT